jgi:hypothetical protein
VNKASLGENAKFPCQICRLQGIVSFATLRLRFEIITTVCLRDPVFWNMTLRQGGSGYRLSENRSFFFLKVGADFSVTRRHVPNEMTPQNQESLDAEKYLPQT